MQISFTTAKNGEKTAQVANKFLHSSYNPSKEAERFVINLKTDFIPKLILITEPALSYVIPYLKNKFKNAKICIIRYVPDFNLYNNSADYVINYYEHKEDLDSFLLYKIGEELLFNTLFIQWQPSTNIFPEINKKVIISIKKAMENAKTLLITREYYEKKWFINSCNFIKYINKTILLKEKINKPIAIISSGPSLNTALTVIKENRDKLFVLALSSSISVCIRNKIIPDLCLSTDGGFWAGQHLKQLKRKFKNIPIALPVESYVDKYLLKNNKILPLSYNDGSSNLIIKLTNIPYMEAERNGTVSGTALNFALSNCTNDIYFFGLDLSTQKGFQHCQPNELEINNCLMDNKINNSEMRNFKAEISTSSIEIYKNWFETLNLSNRNVYRVIDNNYKKNTLGEIKDISTSFFKKKIENKKNCIQSNFFIQTNSNKNLNNINKKIHIIVNSEEWLKTIFPLSFTSLIHDKNKEIINRVNKEKNKIINKIEKILHD